MSEAKEPITELWDSSVLKEIAETLAERIFLTEEEFRAEAKRQCIAVSNSPHEKEDMAFLDSIADWEA